MAAAVVSRPEGKFVRVGYFSGSGGAVRHLSAAIFTQRLGREETDSVAVIRNRALSLDGAPTRGFLPLYSMVFDRVAKTTRWVAFEHETTVKGALAAGATSVSVATPSSIADGDVVGILLDNNTTHWTAVSALAGSTFTIAAIPTGRWVANGARIVFNRWAS